LESKSSHVPKVVIGLLAFTLFNSSDVFLLLKAKESGLSDTLVIGIYIFYNLVYALFAFPIGILADKIGLKKMLILE
jgi:MFS family permease